MHPPTHLSYPSSSSSQFASSYLQRYVHAALASAGFAKSSGQAADLLTEALERYLLLLGSTAQHHASHVGRNKACAWDAELALRDLGSSSEDVQSWLLEDGAEMAGQWQSFGGEAREQADGTDGLYAGTKRLEDRSNLGKAPLSEREPLELFYEDVTPDRLSALEAVFGKDEESDSDSDAKAQSPHTPPPSYSDRSNNETPGKRKRGPSEDRLIPDFLPAFPVKTEVLDVNVAPTVVQDAEFARETTSRLQQGEERSKAGADAADQAALEAKTCTVIDDMTGMPKRSVEDSWQSAVPFSSSMLASGQTADDIPGITEEPSVYPSSEEGATSSMRAFANDYPVLVREARASTPAYLTPSGGAYARVFHQRRAVAAFLTDSSKYVPCDTIFGSISARPSALPFQPTSSMLITPPTSHNSAPTFTPLRPNGRDLPSTTVQSNALYPACRHRNPSNVLNAARLVSGGVGTETYRRMTRIHDPDPILDEQHAERVFHGQPAPKELLVEGNSFLKGALDMLKVKRAEDKAGTRGGMGNGAQVHEVEMNGTDEKQTSQLSMSATRDRIKVKSGTIVSTWDWMSRDHTDAVLPGKKFRTGTAGVMLGGGASGDANADEGRMRHPSESVAGTPGPA